MKDVMSPSWRVFIFPDAIFICGTEKKQTSEFSSFEELSRYVENKMVKIL